MWAEATGSSTAFALSLAARFDRKRPGKRIIQGPWLALTKRGVVALCASVSNATLSYLVTNWLELTYVQTNRVVVIATDEGR